MREPFAETGEAGAGLLTAEAAHPGLTRPLWTDCHLCSIRAHQALLRRHSPPAFRPDAHSCLSRRDAALWESHCVSDPLLLGPLASLSHKPSPASTSRWAGERLNKQFADLGAKNEAPVGNGRGLPWHRSGVGGGAVVPTGGMRLQTLRAVTAGWEKHARPLAPGGWTPSRAPAGPTVKNALVQMSAP